MAHKVKNIFFFFRKIYLFQTEFKIGSMCILILISILTVLYGTIVGYIVINCLSHEGTWLGSNLISDIFFLNLININIVILH